MQTLANLSDYDRGRMAQIGPVWGQDIQKNRDVVLDIYTPMLARSTFLPNHPDFGRYNSVLFKALQGVETGRLTAAKAVEFLEDEMTNELKNAVKIVK